MDHLTESPKGLRASISDTQASSKTVGSEKAVISKTVPKWYQRASIPPVFDKKSLSSLKSMSLNVDSEYSGKPFPDFERGENVQGDVQGDIVDWIDEHDPQNPMNWAKWKKMLNIFVVFLTCFVSAFTSSVCAPAIMYIMMDFHEDNQYLSGFVTSVYVFGLAFGPLIVGPLSEVYGRLIMYYACNITFFIFSCLCGYTTNFRTLALVRFLAGCGGSGAFTLGPATVTDLVSFERRGSIYGILGIAYNLGPALSPILGSYLTDAIGWRWIFRLIGIMGAACTAATVLMSESYEPVLLRRKAKKLRKLTGNQNLHSRFDNGTGTVMSGHRILGRAMIRPFKMLFLLPNVFLVSLLTAVGYAWMYILYSILPISFMFTYAWDEKETGFAYIGTAVGSILGMAVGGLLSDFVVRRRAAQGDTRPENRLLPMILFWPLVTFGFIVYGWTVEKMCAWYWPLIGTVIFGMGATSANLFCNTYVIDAYTMYSASATAATTVTRSVLGGLVPLFAFKMHNAMSAGWMFTTLGLIALLFLPIPVYFFRYGNRR